MIAKISRGGGFRGVLDYILREKAEPEIIGGNLSGENPREMAEEFGQTRRLREDIRKPVYHISLSLPAGERLTDGEWSKVSLKYLSRMGLDPETHQYTLVRHGGTDHSHVHIVASRISLQGEVWSPDYDLKRSRDICRALEQEHGLTVVSSEKKVFRAQTTQKERRMAQRTGRTPEKVQVTEVLSTLLSKENPISHKSFIKVLEKQNVTAVPNIASTGKISGYCFQYAGRNFTGSQVGYGWKHLQTLLLPPTPEEAAWLQERKSLLQQGTPADAARSLRNAVWEVGSRGASFTTALEKQGWVLDNDTLKKGEHRYPLASFVDPEALRRSLEVLGSVSREKREATAERCREIARGRHFQPRRSFMREMGSEDLLLTMALFPQVALFLIALTIAAEAARSVRQGVAEQVLRAQMKEAWRTANTAVREEIRKIQEDIRYGRNHDHGSGTANFRESGADGGAAGGAHSGSIPGLRAVGGGALGAADAGTGALGEPGGSRKTPSVETKDDSRDHSDGVPVRADVFVSSSDAPGSEQSALQTAVGAREIASEAVGLMALAEDLSVLAQGRSSGVSKNKSSTVAYIEQMWERQHSALQAPHYRLTLRWRGPAVDPITGKKSPTSINLGKIRDGSPTPAVDPGLGTLTTREDGGQEVLWTADGVKKKIPELAHYNARGFDVYLTPVDDGFHHLLFDDLTPQGVEYVKKNYSPCEIHSSSKNNFQAILRIPKAEVSEAEQSVANELLRRLNHLPAGCGGDKSISAARHPFRMAGFKNKKPGRESFQSKIELVRPGTVCERAAAELESIREARRAQAQSQERAQRVQAIETAGDHSIRRPEGETVADQVFRWEWKKIHGLALKKTDEGVWAGPDLSVIDYRVCQEMLIREYSETAVAEALERCSPSLCDRHSSDPKGYAARTVAAAAASLEEVPVVREATKAPVAPVVFDGR